MLGQVDEMGLQASRERHLGVGWPGPGLGSWCGDSTGPGLSVRLDKLLGLI